MELNRHKGSDMVRLWREAMMTKGLAALAEQKLFASHRTRRGAL